MGYASYLEDIEARYDACSRQMERLPAVPSRASSTAAGAGTSEHTADLRRYAGLEKRLRALWSAIEHLVSALRNDLELVTDPAYKVYEELKKAQERVRRLETDYAALRGQLDRQAGEYAKEKLQFQMQIRALKHELQSKGV